ncbi:MAG: hypothetical protein AB7R77_23240, partial [Ilumatobacteraceae bacterium]
MIGTSRCAASGAEPKIRCGSSLFPNLGSRNTAPQSSNLVATHNGSTSLRCTGANSRNRRYAGYGSARTPASENNATNTSSGVVADDT